MTDCSSIRDVLLSSGRGRLAEAPDAERLRNHLGECAVCRRILANERMLTAGLAGVAAAQIGPPAALKSALLAEFRQQQVVSQSGARSSVLPRISVAASIAASIAVLWIAFGLRPGPVATATAPAKTVMPPATLGAAIDPAPATPVTARFPDTKPRAHRRLRPVPQAKPTQAASQQPAEVATDFIEIPYTEPLRPGQHADVFRVEMPRANMVVYGMPVTGGRLDSRVLADVLIGEDGVARAIRFVR